MRVRSFLVLLAALTLVTGGASIGTPPAAASVGVGVTPSLLELAATPGGRGGQDLTISNAGDQPVDATVTASPLQGAAADNSAVAWLTVMPASVHLDPSQEQTVNVAIDVPDGLASGGYYASVTITTGATQAAGAAAGFAAQVGVPFLFTIEGTGEVRAEATLDRFAPVLESDGRIGFAALVRSTGNVYIEAQGAVEIADASGAPFASLEFPRSARILPTDARLLNAQGSVPLQAGQSFTATATLSYGDNGTPLTTTQTFTAQPPVVTPDQLGVCENLDRGPTLSLGLHNDGQLGALPGVTLAIRAADGTDLGETTMPDAVLVWPNETDTFTADFPQRLESGQYVFAVTTRIGQDQPVTKELPFQIGGIDGTPAPLCSSQESPAETPAA
jgi:P pilus assembly chaperone PapD